MRLLKSTVLAVLLVALFACTGAGLIPAKPSVIPSDTGLTRPVTAALDMKVPEEPRAVLAQTTIKEASEPLLMQPVDYRLNCFTSKKKKYTYNHLVSDITGTLLNYEGLVSNEVIGQSVQGKNIYALTVGRGPVYVLITAGVHARENANTPLIMQCLFDYLYAATTGDEPKAQILDQVTLIIVPLVNPDGYQYCVSKGNRSKKTNANNVDINRNFPCKYWGSKVKKRGNYYPGPAPASEPETQTIMALFDRYNFTLAVDIHSRARTLICQKGGYTAEDLSTLEDPNRLNEISLSLARYLLEDIKYKQDNELYVKFGEEGTLTDYAFSRGVPTVTFETLKYKKNRLADPKEIQNEYKLFNWPNTLYKIAEFAQRNVQ